MQQISRGDTEQSGKRQSSGKRKLSDQGEPSQPRSQQTISEHFSERYTPEPNHSKTHKRSRLSPSPSRSSSTTKTASHTMYPISDSPPKQGAALGRGLPGSNGPARPQGLNTNTRQNAFSPHTGAKKLVVKNLRSGPRLNQDSYFEKVWSQSEAALTAIFDDRKPESSLEELYKGGENVCRQGRAALLARKLQSRCKEEFVSGNIRKNLLSRAEGSTDIDTLRAVIEAWSAWHAKLVCGQESLTIQFTADFHCLLDYHSLDLLLPRSVVSLAFKRTSGDP
jgi:cullin-4